jgi:hypothetical protein
VTAPAAEAALPEVVDTNAVGGAVDGPTPVEAAPVTPVGSVGVGISVGVGVSVEVGRRALVNDSITPERGSVPVTGDDPPAGVVDAVKRPPPVDTAGLLVEGGSTSVFDDFAELALVATDEFPLDAWFSSSSSQTAQVTIPGPLPPTSISRLARMRVIFPPATSRPTIVRRLSPFNATASMLPALLISNWRGRRPPTGNFWIKEMVPLEGEMRKVKRESEEILVLFLGSGFGIVKLLSLRELTIRYLLSGYCTSVSLAS